MAPRVPLPTGSPAPGMSLGCPRGSSSYGASGIPMGGGSGTESRSPLHVFSPRVPGERRSGAGWCHTQVPVVLNIPNSCAQTRGFPRDPPLGLVLVLTVNPTTAFGLRPSLQGMLVVWEHCLPHPLSHWWHEDPFLPPHPVSCLSSRFWDAHEKPHLAACAPS